MTNDIRSNPKLHDEFDSFNIDDDAKPKVQEEFDTFNIDEDSDSGSHLSILGNNEEPDSGSHINILENNPASDDKSPGVRIRDARQRKKMSVLQVAEHLNLDVNVIERIEADDYAHLPQPLFVRGYFRSLAKLLNIEEETILASFEQLEQGQTQKNTPSLEYPKQKKQVSSRDLWPTVATIGIIITLIALVALWQFYPQTETEELTEIPTESHESPWESSNDLQPITETTLVPEQAEEIIPEPIAEITPEPVTEITSEPTVEIIPESTEPLVQDKSMRVLLKSNVWMRITDKTGKKLYGGTAKAGDILELEGLPPYKVVVGNYNLDIEYQGIVQHVKKYPRTPNSKRTFIVGGDEE